MALALPVCASLRENRGRAKYEANHDSRRTGKLAEIKAIVLPKARGIERLHQGKAALAKPVPHTEHGPFHDLPTEVRHWLCQCAPRNLWSQDVTKYKTVRHFHEPGDLHELTFSCYVRRPWFLNESRCAALSECIDAAFREQSFHLVAFVIMPEHVHLLVEPRKAKPDIGLLLARIKQPFSKWMKQELMQSNPSAIDELTVRERPGKNCFRFWQEGPGFDRNLYTPAAVLASLDYLHTNPVKRGLCERACDWKWSSARYYLSDPPRQQFPDLPYIDGLPLGQLD